MPYFFVNYFLSRTAWVPNARSSPRKSPSGIVVVTEKRHHQEMILRSRKAFTGHGKFGYGHSVRDFWKASTGHLTGFPLENNPPGTSVCMFPGLPDRC